MDNIALIGIDLDKSSFHIYGQDHRKKPFFSEEFIRLKLFEFLATCPAITVMMEACGCASFMVCKLNDWGQGVILSEK